MSECPIGVRKEVKTQRGRLFKWEGKFILTAALLLDAVFLDIACMTRIKRVLKFNFEVFSYIFFIFLGAGNCVLTINILKLLLSDRPRWLLYYMEGVRIQLRILLTRH
jgi:hypothetical protein